MPRFIGDNHMNLRSYNQMLVETIQQPEMPGVLVQLALRMTMRQDYDEKHGALSSSLGEYLIEAAHLSPLEHISYTFKVEGVSRSFLAQITRHRIGSFTAGSQHYQDYRDYPCAVDDPKDTAMAQALMQAFQQYENLIDRGVPQEEARQALPNAACVNLLWSVNVRALINFLQQRLCYRNCKEIQVFANKVLNLVSSNFPEIFNHVGPSCYTGKCMQGKLACGIGPYRKW